MALPKLVAFDLDDTLAVSKAPVDPRVAQQLLDLAERVQVVIISGGNETQFRTQVIARLPEAPAETLSNMHLLPTCGTRYLYHDGDDFIQVYAHDLSDEHADAAMRALRMAAEQLGLWEPNPWGDIIEHRGSQITFSALGQLAPPEAKHAWDPDGQKRAALRAAVAELLPELEVRSGGSTSIDITHAGIDKAYGMRQIAELTGIRLQDMLFFGDRLDEDGNDYPVLALGVPSVAVTGWEDTAGKLDELIPTLPLRPTDR